MVGVGAAARSCEIWGVLNVTPDSFSDGGEALTLDDAMSKAQRLISEGADVIDVGGASSRPAGKTYGDGAHAVSIEEELRRVIPVIQGLVQDFGARVSIDTTRPEVASAALAAGATIVNDVSNGASQDLLEVVAKHGAELVLMHTRGDGSLYGNNVRYTRVVDEVTSELSSAVFRACAAGVSFPRIWVDPGIGFAKTAEQSMQLLASMPRLIKIGCRVLVGPSRKSFIAVTEEAVGVAPSSPTERIGGTAAAVTAAVLQGASAVRVHDVQIMRQAVVFAKALMVQQARAARC